MAKINPLSYNSKLDIRTFNCGGFALKTFNWVLIDDYDIEEISIEESLDICQEYIIELTKNKNPLIPISHWKDAPKNSEVVGFRLEIFDGEIGDFHFIWKDVKGYWWHKPGSSLIERFRENPDKEWCQRYNSEILWFARITNRKTLIEKIKGVFQK